MTPPDRLGSVASRIRCRIGIALLVAALLPATGGCVLLGLGRTERTFEPPPPPRARLVSQVGGTHHASVVHEGRWYTGLGAELLVLDARNGRERRRVEVLPPGTAGPIVDLLVSGDTLFVVLEDTAVAEFDLADPDSPELLRELPAAELGILPRRVAEADGSIFASGVGGVVDLLQPGSPALATLLASLDRDEAGIVVPTGEGVAAVVGRRIYRLAGEKYLGAATELVPLPAGVGPAGGVAFALQGRDAAEVGLMTADLRVTAARAVPAEVRRLRVFGGHLWVIEDRTIAAFPIEGDALGDPMLIAVRGARDLAEVDGNILAVCGEFGRALYRIRGDGRGGGDEFFAVAREASELTDAVHDGRRVLAGGSLGHWLYSGNRAELTEPPQEERDPTPPRREAVAVWGRAEIAADGLGVEVDAPPWPLFKWSPQPPGEVHAVLAVGESLWIGHDRGLELLRFTPEAGFASVGSIRVEGPVRYLFPHRNGTSVNFVSVRGGFGTVDDR